MLVTKRGETPYNDSGNPLELKLRLINWKHLIIGRVMTSLSVITFEIGQSARKKSKSAIFIGEGYDFRSTTARVSVCNDSY